MIGRELQQSALTCNLEATTEPPVSTEDILEFCTMTDSVKVSNVYLEQPRSFHSTFICKDISQEVDES